ncbi:hypothetical protein ACW9I8_07010 [Pseudomonas reactans]
MSSEPTVPASNSLPSVVNDLEPAYLHNSVLNVLGADVGAGIRHIENYMHVNIPRWVNLSPLDEFEFYMRNQLLPMASSFVRPGEESLSHYQLAIPQEVVPVGFSFPCFCVVRRVGPVTPSRSDDFTWFIKATRPGGSDLGHEAFHPALIVSLPDDLARPGAVLDPDRALLGIVLTVALYPNIRERDTVEAYFDGHLVTLSIDLDHVLGAKPIEVRIPPEIIALTNSGLITIRIALHDEVLNRSGPDRRFSKAVHLESDLHPGLLSRPFFLFNGDEIFDVNFDTHGKGHFEIEVVTSVRLPDGTSTPAGTQIVATLSGVRADGTLLNLQLPAFPARIGRSAFADVDNAILKELINGTLRVSYELQFPLGNTLANSRRVAVTIFGIVSLMPAVTIVQNEGGFISPDLLFITVLFPNYEPYGRDYNVTLRMEVVLPTGGVVSFEQTRLAGNPPPQPRTVLREGFERFIGLGKVKVFYRVDDGEIVPTDVGTLTVRESEPLYVQFGDPMPQMPKAEIEGTDENDNLDLELIVGSVAVTLPYTLTRPLDQVTWVWTGTGGPGGSTGGTFTLNGGTAGSPIVFDVDKSFVENNLDGEIRLRYYLERTGSDTLFSEELVVTVGKALRPFGKPEVLEADTHPDRLAPEAATEGATVRVAFMEMVPTDRIRVEWRGIAGIGTYIETKDGNAIKVVDFTVPKAVVGANILPFGRDIEVQFFLIRGAREIPSQVLVLRLLPLVNKSVPLIDGIGNVPILDLFSLSNTARTRTLPWLFIHRDQRVWMEYRGTFVNGGSFIEKTYTADRLGEEDEVAGLSPPTPVDQLKNLRDGSTLTIKVMVSFDRSVIEGNAVTMEVKDYIIRSLPGTLSHPTLVGADGTGPVVSVNPRTIEHNRAVNVSYAMSTEDDITLEWVYQDGVIPYIAPKKGLVGGTVVFAITTEILARSVNSRIQLRYSVLRNGNTIKSDVQTVNVGTISTNLPAPTLNGRAGGVLDLAQFTGDALASVGKWPLSAAGTYAQMVWLICTSPDATDPLYVLSNYAINAAEQANGLLNIPVSRAWLQSLKYDSAVTVTCKVTYDGSSVESRAITFPLAHFTVRPGLLDDTTEFNNNNLNGWGPIHPTVSIHIGHSGSEYYIFTAHKAYMGCQKTYANAGPGVYEVTVRYRNSTRTTRNYVYLNVASVRYFTATVGSNWSNTVQGPLISDRAGALFVVNFESSLVQISSIRVRQISRS